MKKLIYRLPVLLLGIVFAFASCDYVDQPYMEGGNGNNVKDTVRKILIEDFTGHACINCPDAHDAGRIIIDLYGDQVVFVAIHAGYFSQPDNPPFDYDFRTPMGNDLYNHFGVSVVPIGMINRTPKNGSSTPLIGYTGWASEASRYLDSLSEEPDAYIHLDVSFDAADSTIDISTETTFFSPNATSRKYNLVLVVTESKIIKAQKHGSITIPDYEHNHVLRGGVTSTWGDEIHDGIVSTGDVKTKDYSNFKLGSDWNPDNCHVVAYLYYNDGADQYKIIQAQEVSVK